MNEKHYDLRFLPLFEDDLNEIVDYITYRLRNPAAAERLVDDVEAAILERLPCAESFEPFHSARERQYPYYRIQVRNFTVFYVVIGNIMEVRRILYNRRNWKETALKSVPRSSHSMRQTGALGYTVALFRGSLPWGHLQICIQLPTPSEYIFSL